MESCSFVDPTVQGYMCNNWNGAATSADAHCEGLSCKGQSFSDKSACFESSIILASFRPPSTRLIDCRSFEEGCCRIEVFHWGEWGTVCDDSWDDADARVVCAEMGCLNGTHLPSYGGGGGQSSSRQIWLDEVQCTGAEASLSDCPHSGWGMHDCYHSEDAGVCCAGINTETGTCCQDDVAFNTGFGACDTYRSGGANEGNCIEHGACSSCGCACAEACRDRTWGHATGRPAYQVRLAQCRADNTCCRVEVLKFGEWGTVCSDSWDDADARVVCAEMGCLNGTHLPSYGGGGGQSSSRQIWLDEVQCTGAEASLSDCPHSEWGMHDCYHHQDAGVCCTGINTDTGTCCQDNVAFNTGFGACDTYGSGGTNEGNCIEHDACSSCGCACAEACKEQNMLDVLLAAEGMPGVACYESRCTRKLDGTYGLEILDPSGAWHTCQTSMTLSVAGYKGSISCPTNWQSFCHSPDASNSRYGQGIVPIQIPSTPPPKPSPSPHPAAIASIIDFARRHHGECQEMRTWRQLLFLSATPSTTGGLGSWMVLGMYEVWLCVPDNACSASHDPFCFTFDEATRLFVALGYNSDLGLISHWAHR